MTRISASIICCDEERNIEECLKSVAWCDEIVVVDSGSSDRTVELARKFTDKVIHHPWPGYVAQKNFALDQATGDWILCLDADERCTPELKGLLQQHLAGDCAASAFEVKRHVWYQGRWINHGGWYPDWKVRVVRRGQARWEGTDPHDKLVPQGKVLPLDADIVHYTYRNFAHQIGIINRFSDVATEEAVKSGKRFSLLKMLFHPPVKFLECYVWKRGFLDGLPGFIIATASSFYVFAKHAKLWEKRSLHAPTEPRP